MLEVKVTLRFIFTWRR